MNILVIAAHPDDIEPQMGGTIAKYVREGHMVKMILLTRTGGDIEKIRNKEGIEAAKILGVEELIHLQHSQENFTYNRALINEIDNLIKQYNPREIFTLNPNDSHQDHQIVAKAVISACRKNNINLYFFENVIPGGNSITNENYNYYVDISDTFFTKMQSIRAHSSQIEKFGEEWLSGIEGRSKFRGFQMNVKYAEAFILAKYFRR